MQTHVERSPSNCTRQLGHLSCTAMQNSSTDATASSSLSRSFLLPCRALTTLEAGHALTAPPTFLQYRAKPNSINPMSSRFYFTA